jgi:hypothetical protein
MFNSTVKTLAAAAILVGAGTTAFASDHIFADTNQNLNSYVSLDLVRASADGTVDIYELTANGQGQLLGSAPVRAGANTNVNVQFNTLTNQDVIAVLSANGSVTASEEIDRTN